MKFLTRKDLPKMQKGRKGNLHPDMREALDLLHSDKNAVVLFDELDAEHIGLKGIRGIEQAMRRYGQAEGLTLSVLSEKDQTGGTMIYVVRNLVPRNRSK